MEGKPTQLHDRSVHIYQGDKEKIPELARKALERRQGLLLRSSSGTSYIFLDKVEEWVKAGIKVYSC